MVCAAPTTRDTAHSAPVDRDLAAVGTQRPGKSWRAWRGHSMPDDEHASDRSAGCRASQNETRWSGAVTWPSRAPSTSHPFLLTCNTGPSSISSVIRKP